MALLIIAHYYVLLNSKFSAPRKLHKSKEFNKI